MMANSLTLPFSDFSSRFRKNIRQRPTFYVLTGPSLAESSPAISDHIDLDPMIGTHNEITGVMDLLRPINRPLDIWMNIKSAQDTYDWKTFVELLDNPETSIILTPYVWMAHSHMMELEREFVVQRFHKVISMDLEMQRLASGLHENVSVNSLTYFLFLAHLLEFKGPIFLFGCDGVDANGDVEGYEVNDHFGNKDRKHLLYDDIDEERIRSGLIADTQGINESWPVFEQWFERRKIRKIPIYNVSGAGHVTAFETIKPSDIPSKVELCDRDFDPDYRIMSSGKQFDQATLEANLASYEHFCGQFTSSQILRRIIPNLASTTEVMQQSKEQTMDALNMVMKLLMRIDNK